MQKTIGIIGLGSIGSRHAQNLVSMGHYILGYDPNPIIAGLGITYVNQVDALLDAEAVIIASPTPTHQRYITDMLGKPLFVEKPLSDREMEPCYSNIVMVGYNLRFKSSVQKAKQWLDEERIGKPLWANFIVAQHNTKYIDHVVFNWSHEIDLALYLLGPAKVMSSVGNEFLTDITAVHSNYCQTTIHLDYLTTTEMRTFRIIGTKGSIEVNLAEGTNRQPAAVLVDGTTKLNILDFHSPKDTFAQNYHEEMRAFVSRLNGKKTPGCTFEEGYNVLQFCLKATPK